MRYFIIGFKGSGKTTLGRQLAERLNMKFIDLDEYIEEIFGRSVIDIYSTEGEDEFRNKEWKALKEVIKPDHIVVSTGGGAPCNCDNINLMEQNGEVIYLDVYNDTLFKRLKLIANERPILKNKTENELKLYIRQQKNICEPQYLRAKYIIRGQDITVEKVLEIIISSK